MPPFTDDQPTLVMSPSDADKSRLATALHRPDETIVSAALEHDDAPAENARFIPPDATEDLHGQTVIWQPNRALSVRGLKAWARGTGSRLCVRPALMGLAAALVVLAVLGLSWWNSAARATEKSPAEGTGARPDGGPETASSRTSNPVQTLGATAVLPPPTPLVPVDAVSLADAAEALLAGRLDEARKLYRTLSTLHPENRSFALAADILTPGAPAKETP